MKRSPRFLATLVCLLVLSVPGCSTLDKADANQLPKLTEVHQARGVATEAQVSATPIEPHFKSGEVIHSVAEPEIAVMEHLPYRGCRPIPALILCFMPCCF